MVIYDIVVDLLNLGLLQILKCNTSPGSVEILRENNLTSLHLDLPFFGFGFIYTVYIIVYECRVPESMDI